MNWNCFYDMFTGCYLKVLRQTWAFAILSENVLSTSPEPHREGNCWLKTTQIVWQQLWSHKSWTSGVYIPQYLRLQGFCHPAAMFSLTGQSFSWTFDPPLPEAHGRHSSSPAGAWTHTHSPTLCTAGPPPMILQLQGKVKSCFIL